MSIINPKTQPCFPKEICVLSICFTVLFCPAIAQFGGNISLNGSNQAGSAPVGMLNGATVFTIEFWIKTTENRSSSTYWQCPTLIGVATYNAHSNDFGITTSNGYIGMWSGLNSGGDNSFLSSSIQINDNNWHHIAAVNDGSNINLFVDGKKIGSIASGLSLQTLTAPLTVGASSLDFPNPGNILNNLNFFHEGIFDEVRFSNNVRYKNNFVPPTSAFTSDANTLALYHFGNGCGTGAFDASSNKNTMTLFGNLQNSCPIGQNGLCQSSFGFENSNGSSVVIEVNAPASLSQLYNAGGFTWEAWFKLNSPIINQSLIISTEDAVLYQDIFLGFGWGGNPNELSFLVSENSSTNTVSVTSSQNISLNTWYHVAAVCDYANGELKLYINGNLAGIASITPEILNDRMSVDHLTQIGNASARESAIDGDIDEVKFWKTARTEAEIKASMNQCLVSPQPGLVAYFKADENAGIIANSTFNSDFFGLLENVGWSTQAPGINCFNAGIKDSTISCNTFDFKGSININATAISSWLWDFGDGNAASTQNATHAFSGQGTKTIKLIITGINGCTDSSKIDIVLNSINSPLRDTSVSICPGTTDSLTKLYNTSGYTNVVWSTATPYSAGIGTDSLIVTNSAGCKDTAVIIITASPKPNLGKDLDTSICGSGFINITNLYNTGGYVIVTWIPPTPNNVGAGIDSLIVSNSAGCKDTATVTIMANPKPSLGNDTAISICGGSSINITNLYNTAGYQTVTWIPPNPTNAGVGLDSSIVTNSEGCRDTAVVTITANPKPNLGADISKTVCEGTTVDLTTLYNTTGYNYVVWSTPAPNHSGTVPDTLVVTNAAGCTDTAVATITINTKAYSTIDTAICYGQTFAGYNKTGTYVDILSATNKCDSIRTINLMVYPNAQTVIDTIVCYPSSFEGYTASGTYTKMLKTVATNCDSVVTIHLTVTLLPMPSLVADTSICPGQTILLNPGSFASYLWQDGSIKSSYSVTGPGNYSVKVANSCGMATGTTIVTQRSCDIYFPTVFTPNGDGKNDFFKAFNGYGLQNFHLVMYNRWGQKIFETHNIDEGWDGTLNGMPQNPGAYVWYCQYTKQGDNQLTNAKGTVVLIR